MYGTLTRQQCQHLEDCWKRWLLAFPNPGVRASEKNVLERQLQQALTGPDAAMLVLRMSEIAISMIAEHVEPGWVLTTATSARGPSSTRAHAGDDVPRGVTDLIPDDVEAAIIAAALDPSNALSGGWLATIGVTLGDICCAIIWLVGALVKHAKDVDIWRLLSSAADRAPIMAWH
jgi:hypothetical protein